MFRSFFLRIAEVAKALASRHTLLLFFDEAWYRDHNRDVVEAGVDPRRHFLRHGYREIREAHPFFSTKYYLEHNPEVRAKGLSPLEHYLKFGIKEGRPPNLIFDPAWYKKRNTLNHAKPAPPHFLSLRAIHRFLDSDAASSEETSPFFDAKWYAQQYHLSGAQNPFKHFLTIGLKAGHVGHPLFDKVAYEQANPDVARGIREGTLASGYEHFLIHGSEELAKGSLRSFPIKLNGRWFDFDAKIYVADNPDVRVLIGKGEYPSAIAHFFTVGWREVESGMRALYARQRLVQSISHRKGAAGGKQGEHICLFAHYDADQFIDSYVVEYVKALRALDVDIVFITATSKAEELRRIEPFVREILVKNEAGRDFGSWYLGVKTLGTDAFVGYRYLLFVNDSIYFPVCDPRQIFARMSMKNFNFWGLTDSREDVGYHIQSFFLGFDKRAREVLLPEFLRNYEEMPFRTKKGQIHAFEYGLTSFALEQSLSVGAYCAVDDVREDVIRQPALEGWRHYVQFGLNRINPAHHLWDLFVEYYACPILKLELLRDNPAKIANVESYPNVIDRAWFDPLLIEAHLQRAQGGSFFRKSLPMEAPVVTSATLRLERRIQGSASIFPERLVLLAHFDPDGQIDDHIVHQIKALHAAGCTVVLITTSSNEEAELAWILPHVWTILVRDNVGYDFGSWALALHELRGSIGQFESVIWMNDSTYFPLFDPKPMFAEMTRRGADFWGVVDSFNVRWHVMSWFWVFNRKVIEAGWFDWFLKEYNPNHSKWEQIRNCEMRLPLLLREHGFKVDSYIRAEEVKAFVLEHRPVHPRATVAQQGDFTMTHDFWDLLITDFRCPALKVEMVRDNPLGLDLSSLLKLVGEQTEFDPDLILRHVRRVKCGHLFPEFRTRKRIQTVQAAQ
jgi:rhamnosyltransferase